ncbi:MAG: 5-(carboxyamino)imidazole ribonucleotide synthase [Alphaproteobacteria bacterium]|nr:5-(carboxyamino)imidazole ribonucleotide synthase [Alphaproteobacteria bacterium]
MTPLPPGSTIGMMGGGQLGRMTALAAAELGYRLHVFTPETDSPCAQVSAKATVAGYGDAAALDAFANAVDVVTLEFENLPAEALDRIARIRPVRPSAAVLRVAQDRLLEKEYCRKLGIGTAPYRKVDSLADLDGAVGALGCPAVLKTRRLGYDGKGQVKIAAGSDLSAALASLKGAPAILEGFVDFAREVSVIAARGLDGSIVTYPAVENRHENHILATTVAPAEVSPAVAVAARGIATSLIDALEVVGLLAVEMFVTADGRVLVNELAPRPHNSGHWTIEGCPTSQFAQLVRAVAGLPLGAVEPFTPAEMTNLIGEGVRDWPRLIADPTAHLHLYGKAEARPGRKMGHVTRLRRP